MERLAHLHPHLPRGLLSGGNEAHEFRHLLGSHHLRNRHHARLGPMPGRDPVGNRRTGKKHWLRSRSDHGDQSTRTGRLIATPNLSAKVQKDRLPGGMLARVARGRSGNPREWEVR